MLSFTYPCYSTVDVYVVIQFCNSVGFLESIQVFFYCWLASVLPEEIKLSEDSITQLNHAATFWTKIGPGFPTPSHGLSVFRDKC